MGEPIIHPKYPPAGIFFNSETRYPVSMDTLPIPLPRSLTVFCAPAANGEPVSLVIAGLAQRGPVSILDGGNCFPAYRLLRLLRLQNKIATAGNIFVQRAFTCYQMLALLEGTPGMPQPHVVLDPFASFYDEQVLLPEISRLLEGCLYQLERLRQAAPLLVVLRPAHTPERAFLVERVCAAAGSCFISESLAPASSQPTLF